MHVLLGKAEVPRAGEHVPMGLLNKITASRGWGGVMCAYKLQSKYQPNNGMG